MTLSFAYQPPHRVGAQPAAHRRVRRSAQRGVSLVFSLMTLVALSLAAVALIRSVDTGATILGNLSFKQDTLLAAEDASRQAIQWLASNTGGTTLHNNVLDQGYSASLIASLDPTGTRATDTTRVVIDWERNGCADYPTSSFASCFRPRNTELELANGVRARWAIMRVCASAGDPSLSTVLCSRPVTAGTVTGGIQGSQSYPGTRPPRPVLTQYFRVIVRAEGGRNTTSITETLVHF